MQCAADPLFSFVPNYWPQHNWWVTLHGHLQLVRSWSQHVNDSEPTLLYKTFTHTAEQSSRKANSWSFQLCNRDFGQQMCAFIQAYKSLNLGLQKTRQWGLPWTWALIPLFQWPLPVLLTFWCKFPLGSSHVCWTLYLKRTFTRPKGGLNVKTYTGMTSRMWEHIWGLARIMLFNKYLQ